MKNREGENMGLELSKSEKDYLRRIGRWADKIYAVISGDSDRDIAGYCTTYELAEKYCSMCNKGDIEFGNYRVEALSCLDDRAKRIEEIWYVYRFAFYWKGNKVCVSHINAGNGERYVTDVQYNVPEVKDGRFDKRFLENPGFWNGDIRVVVWVDKEDIEEAKKIATDAFYIWLSKEKKAGIVP